MISFICMEKDQMAEKGTTSFIGDRSRGIDIYVLCRPIFFLCKQTVSLDDDDDYVTRFFPMTFSCSGLKMAHRHALSPTLGKHFLCVFLLNNYLIMVQCGRPVSVSH
jgi:hypothetical protein